jgi:hypothetical protein
MNVLPKIDMPAKAEQQTASEPEPEVAESVLPESGDGNMELIDELHQEKQVDFEDILTVTERDVPEEDDVFGDPPAPKVTPLDVSEAAELAEEPEEFPVKKGKRKYTRKAPMSEKQKEHLARIRKIAVEKRKAEKERKIKEKEDAVIEKAEKKILEEDAVIEKAEKKILAKQRKEEEKQHQAEQHNNKKAQEIINNESKPQNGFTKADLDSAVLSAISQYDTLRKQEKKEKRAHEAKVREEEKMRATLARAIQPQSKSNPTSTGK